MRKFIELLQKSIGWGEKSQPGRTLDQLAQDLSLPELLDLHKNAAPQNIVSIHIDDHVETLSYKPSTFAGNGFSLCVDMDNVQKSPAMRLSFEEVARGRFEPSGFAVNYSDNRQVILPSEKSVSPIRRVRQEFLAHINKFSLGA